jgi:hypothetical protein
MILTNEIIQDVFDNLKSKTGFDDVELNFHTPLKSFHFFATSEGGKYSVNALTGGFATMGIEYLRANNDPVYRSAQKIFGENPTNKQVLEFIMAHEFGHIDHFKKGIDFDDIGESSVLGDREAYKNTGQEKWADDFAENIIKKDAPVVHPEAPPKSGEVPEVEASSKSGGNTSPPDEKVKPKTADPDGAIPKEQAPNKNTTAVNKVKAKKLGKLGMLGLAVNGGIGMHSYMQNRSQGDDAVTAAIDATAETAIAAVVGPGKFLAGLGLMQVPGMAKDAYEDYNRRSAELRRFGSMRPFEGNTFVDNKQIFTMRQASMVAMQQSKYSLEHAMQGNEASFLHR